MEYVDLIICFVSGRTKIYNVTIKEKDYFKNLVSRYMQNHDCEGLRQDPFYCIEYMKKTESNEQAFIEEFINLNNIETIE